MTELLALLLAALLGLGATDAGATTTPADSNPTQSVGAEEQPPPDNPDARAYIIDLG